jgi:hypothetical protein
MANLVLLCLHDNVFRLGFDVARYKNDPRASPGTLRLSGWCPCDPQFRLDRTRFTKPSLKPGDSWPLALAMVKSRVVV